jgi:carboxymethylenebutenolidase
MPQKTAADFHPEVLGWFDKYVHGVVDRRGFLNGVQKYAVGGVTATMLLEALSPQFARAQKVPKDDPRIKSSFVEFASPEGTAMRGHSVKPPMRRASSGIPVVHEPRAQPAHRGYRAASRARQSRRVRSRRVVPLGGYPGDEDKARDLFALSWTRRNRARISSRREILKASRSAPARSAPSGSATVVASSTCWRHVAGSRRGRAVLWSAAHCRNGQIKASLFIHYAGNDDRLNAGWPAYEAALKAASVKYEMFKYSGTEHGFNNDTTPRYDDPAAKLAWERTVAFFNKTLRS